MKVTKTPPKVVATLNERWRVIEAPKGWTRQSILQRRKGSYSIGGSAWVGSAFCATKRALLRNIGERAGDVDPNALAIIDALPDKAS